MESDHSILVVDDVPLFRELGKFFLHRFGRVITASSGEEALALVRSEQPDVVVLDIRLPDLAGEQVCRQIIDATASKGTAVVALTSGSPEDHAIAVQAGAADVVAKPLGRDALVEAVRRFLNEERVPGLPRVDVATPVELWTPEKRCMGTVRNLSRGGLFIEAEWFPPAETEMRLAFELPEEEHAITPTAKLVWRRVHANGGIRGMGVRFLALDGKCARSLRGFVHERYDGPTEAEAAPESS